MIPFDDQRTRTLRIAPTLAIQTGASASRALGAAAGLHLPPSFIKLVHNHFLDAREAANFARTTSHLLLKEESGRMIFQASNLAKEVRLLELHNRAQGRSDAAGWQS